MTTAAMPAIFDQSVPLTEGPASNRIEIWARRGRDGAPQVRFISDAVAVADCGAERIDVLFLDTRDEADAVAHRAGEFLAGSPGMAPDADGWHPMPDDVPLDRVLSTLLQASRNAAWAERATDVGLAPDDAELPRTALPGGLTALVGAPRPIKPASDLPDRVVVALSVAEERPRRTRSARVWTRERDRVFVEMILTGHTAKEIALDPRFAGLSENAIYQHASDIGMSFRLSPQITIRGLPSSVLAVYDQAAAVCHKSRDGLVRHLLLKAAADPDRYGLTAI